jgi:hypothetical protein
MRTDAGHTLRSLFDGMPIHKVSAGAQTRTTAPCRPAGQTLWSRLVSKVTPSVYAIGCDPNCPCAGHYFVSQKISCTDSCLQGGVYYTYIADPNQAGYCAGDQCAGFACNGCTCTYNNCDSCGGNGN